MFVLSDSSNSKHPILLDKSGHLFTFIWCESLFRTPLTTSSFLEFRKDLNSNPVGVTLCGKIHTPILLFLSTTGPVTALL